MASAGALAILLTLKNQATPEMKKAQKDLKAFGVAATALGGSIVAAGLLSVKSYADQGDAIDEMAARTGLGAKAISELQYAAKQSGVSLSGLENTVKIMARTIGSAGDANSATAKTFQRLGVDIAALKSMSPEQQFMRLSEAVADVSDPTERAAAALDVFGKSGTDLLPMLADGADGLAKLRKEANDMGVVFDDKAAKAAAGFSDAMDRLQGSATGIKNVIAAALMPALQSLADKVTTVVTGIRDWAAAHPALAAALTTTTFGVGALLLGIGSMVLMLPKLVVFINAVKVGMIALYGAMGPAGIALAALAVSLAIIIPKLQQTSGWTASVGIHAKTTATSVDTLKTSFVSLRAAAESTLASLQAQQVAVQAGLDKAVTAIQKEYGAYQLAGNSKIELVRRVADAAIAALDKEITAAQSAHDEKMTLLDEEYNAKLRTLDDATNADLQRMQGIIDGIDSQAEKESRARQDAADEQRRADLNGQLAYATDADEKIRIRKELADLESEINRRHLADQRADQKDALRKSMDMVRQNAADQREALAEDLKTKKTRLEEETTNLTTELSNRKTALETAATDEITQLATVRDAAIDAEQKKVDAFTKRIEDVTKARDQYEIEELASIARIKEAWQGIVGGSAFMPLPPGAMGPPAPISAYGAGGIVTRPTLALIGESGPEAVVPLSKGNMGGNTYIYITNHVAGSVKSERDLVAAIRQGLIQTGRANVSALGSFA